MHSAGFKKKSLGVIICSVVTLSSVNKEIVIHVMHKTACKFMLCVRTYKYTIFTSVYIMEVYIHMLRAV